MVALHRLGAGLSACVMFACVEAPPDLSATDDPFLDRLSCLGQTPACLGSCDDGDVVAGATCESGVWRCELGIRADLCCDPTNAPEGCPDWGETCDTAEPCQDGYTCVRSRGFPIPVAPDDTGLCRLGDWGLQGFDDCEHEGVLLWPEALLGGTIRPVQVQGVVGVEPRCDDRPCTGDDPCCQLCVGAYTLALVTSDGQPMTIALRTETTACGGTNCGFSCAPLQPGRRYRVWGLWDPAESAGSGTLLYAGHCDD